ncbi:hypothetical protein [Variovorax guangxiensis]|uniref:Uncharacterized protein n=1 Tax=Variovorax guangxiensis TaxID=1775474 RepID=A0A502DXQ1_9BURK|nr:hypothetical protein [Variovorax guangxiensis]RZI65522.1 MAG: hypothetical protein EOP79_11115 [Variovorax sp.]TPG26382.1 hypothetical protein EAH83_00965 [Variovorax ginsengisoli]TPG30107.1 hypothetical protein EAH82_00965 [Variovorax guangxiensis]
MPTILRTLINGTAQDIQLADASPVPRLGEIVETGVSDEPGAQRLEVTEVRYVLAAGTLNAIVECRAPTVGLANQGADPAR